MDLSNAIPACGYKEVQRKVSSHITVITRYSNQQGSKSRLDPCQAPPTESFNHWGGRVCHKFVPVLVGDAPKIAPPGDITDESPPEMSSIRGKLADHVGDRVVLSLEGVVLVTSPGTESSYPRPLQSLNDSNENIARRCL